MICRNRLRLPFGFWAAGGAAVLGLVILMSFPGFSFSAYCCFAVAGICLIFQCLVLLRRRHLKLGTLFLWICSGFLFLGLTAALITGIFIGRAAKGSADTPCAYMIVLGAGVNGTTPSMSLAERIDAAAQYLEAHPDTVCIVSGGQGAGEDITEAACMFRELTEKGICADRIWLEERSTSTQENLAFSLALIEERTGTRPDNVAVVSSGYHLFRAGLIAKSQGLAITGIPAKTQWFALYCNYFLREIAAVWYYTVFGG